MNLLSDKNVVVDAEFSFGTYGNNFSIVVESSGGATETTKRRNPDYNKLVSLILDRLKKLKVAITGIYLESNIHRDLSEEKRRVSLAQDYPINLSGIDADNLRKEIGRKLSKMLQAQGVNSNGNAQKRFRIDLSRKVSPEEIGSVLPVTLKGAEEDFSRKNAQRMTATFTDKADIALLLEPTRRIVIERGYTISGQFLDQVRTAICNHLPITKVWVLIRPKGDLLLRLFFSSTEQRDRHLSTLATMGLDCSIDKSLHKDIAAAFVLRIRIPLHSQVSTTASLAENAAFIAQLVEKILAQANSSTMPNLADTTSRSTLPASQAVEKYVEAFRSILDRKGDYLKLLKVHYEAPERTITAQEMAATLGYGKYSVANRNYGRLAKLVCEKTDFKPEKVQLEVLVIFERRQNQWHWQMRPEVAEALERLEWVKKSTSLVPRQLAPCPQAELECVFQKNLAESLRITSAARQARLKNAPRIPQAVQVLSRAYVRNSDVVVEVLMRANGVCERCKSKAPFIRASDGSPYLEVHHRVPLGDGGEDTVDNAFAVCPNCHRYLHFGKQ